MWEAAGIDASQLEVQTESRNPDTILDYKHFGVSAIFTLTQWIKTEEENNIAKFKDISRILVRLQVNFKVVSDLLSTPTHLRYRAKIDTSLEDTPAMVNDLMIKTLKDMTCLFALITDLEKEPLFISDEGKYILYIRPLEGDVIINTVNPLGTIFCIYKRISPNGRKISRKLQILCRGVDIVLTGIVVYGMTTTIMISNSPNKVLEFHLDYVLCEFIIFDRNLRVPIEGRVYYTDEKCSPKWDKKICQIIYSRKDTKHGKNCSYRLLASKCAMIYRIIKNGGVYILPNYDSTHNDSALLIFEANPLSHLIRAAGGSTTTGLYSPLEMYPDNVFQRVPLFIGSKTELLYVNKILNFERSLE